ncbi:hypothetical protein DKU76_02710 [Salmonella enterica subsp. enterica serovar Napoli]|nr:hypothetical protein [Salmonella enterica subsp. enterica serovar Napoli]MLU44609.1 hypothetical protein [Salmonella enterica subsp. enterica serovar Napoli]
MTSSPFCVYEDELAEVAIRKMEQKYPFSGLGATRSVRPNLLQGYSVAQKRQDCATTSNVSHSQIRLREVMKMQK